MITFALDLLPDFLLDHTLLEKEPERRIGEFWQRWVRMVAGLWTLQSQQVFVLRFHWLPLTGRIRMSVMVHEDAAESIRLGLGGFGISVRKITAIEQASDDSFWVRCGDGACCEIRQEETAVPIALAESGQKIELPPSVILETRKVDRLLYRVTPWWGPGDSFLTPFTSIASQSREVVVCAVLVPTHLEEGERGLLAEIARQAEGMAQLQTRPETSGGVTITASQNKTDPQLRFDSRIYAANLRRLAHPFLTTAFVFSPDPGVCQRVADSFTAAIREETPFATPVGESDHLPSGAKVAAISTQRQYSLGNQISLCRDGGLSYFKDSTSDLLKNDGHPLHRLRFLTDARGAAMVFRLPVNVRGGVPGLEVRQRPPDFHPGPCRGNGGTGEIQLGRFHSGSLALISAKAFTSHALIVGFTGSGKTNTVFWLLDQFWKSMAGPGSNPESQPIPFLVIESAKKEYRGLRNAVGFGRDKTGRPILRIYTLGNESCAPMRFNPFELIPGVRVELHISRLQTCFEAALPHVGPLPSIIAESLHAVYRQAGWRLTDLGPDTGSNLPRSFPTMMEFYEAVRKVAQSRGYAGDVKSNIEAAITGRIKPLLLGGRGLLFGARRSNPSAEALFTNPTILELNDLNEQDKSLVMMFLLTALREYREQNPLKGLGHVTVVEEAHNVLENVASTSGEEGGKSDVKAKAVQAFGNMLAEVRSYGEGLIISDQSPEKLARDAMRNTNVQIAHQLRDVHDREAIAGAMIMDREQCDYLGKLPPGHAAVFYTGLEKATFITVPNYKEKNTGSDNVWVGFADADTPRESDRQVEAWMHPITVAYREMLPCIACRNENSCQADRMRIILTISESCAEQFRQLLDNLAKPGGAKAGKEGMRPFAKLIRTHLSSRSELDLAWCCFENSWQRYREQTLTLSARKNFLEAFRLLERESS